MAYSKRALSATKLDTDQSFISIATAQMHTFTTTMIGSRELPMPNVTRISSLSQAQATLLHCWTKLTKFNQEQSPTASFAWSPNSAGNERENFQSWLDRWEAAFGAFLSNAMASMTNEDITLSRVLKSNHLACTVLASSTNAIKFDAFHAEFRAIIELAGAVLRSRYVTDSPQQKKSSSDLAPFIPILDVKEPLLVVLSRCHQEPLRERANELLSTYHP